MVSLAEVTGSQCLLARRWRVQGQRPQENFFGIVFLYFPLVNATAQVYTYYPCTCNPNSQIVKLNGGRGHIVQSLHELHRHFVHVCDFIFYPLQLHLQILNSNSGVAYQKQQLQHKGIIPIEYDHARIDDHEGYMLSFTPSSLKVRESSSPIAKYSIRPISYATICRFIKLIEGIRTNLPSQ